MTPPSGKIQERLYKGRGVLLLGFALVACGEADGDREQQSMPSGTPIAVTDLPQLIVGEESGDTAQALHRVTSPFLLPDGLLVVPLAEENVIRVFDEDGNLVRTHGGDGEGPGEFVALGKAWAVGDVIEAFDSRQRRVTRFAPGGEVEVIRLQGNAPVQAAVPVLNDGTRVFFGVRTVARTGRDEMVLHHFGPTGNHLAELLEFRGMRRYAFPGGSGPDPLSPRAVVRTHGEDIFVAETTDSRIHVLHASTGARSVIEWDGALTRFSGDPARRAQEAALQRAGSADARAHIEARFDALTGDESFSEFWDFIVDEEGFIWVRPFDPATHGPDVGGMGGPGPGGAWVILSPKGELVTRVDLPADLEPTSIMRDAVVGIRRDDLGVESVRVHRLERVGES